MKLFSDYFFFVFVLLILHNVTYKIFLISLFTVYLNFLELDPGLVKRARFYKSHGSQARICGF